MPDSYVDKLLASIDNAVDKAHSQIIDEWSKAKTRDTREAYHSEMQALDRVVKKLKRLIRDDK